MARRIIGTVTSDKQDKTIVVTVQRQKTHPIYKKTFKVSKKFQAHDEKGQAKIGDKVEIIETIPMSKTKHFKLVKVLETANVLETLADEEPKV
ncbi:MAG TPA: 30S ribosomal protein S17 [Candidatus Saccharimonadales bacterium]|nr:30S ribosomal protein S17 [Candidatus Saccharimonadales bacterium]